MRFGVDIGGTFVKIGLVDGQTLIRQFSIPTRKESLFEDICEKIKQILKENPEIKIEGIGFGIPGHVVSDHIDQMPNIGIRNVDLKPVIQSVFPDWKIKSTNDANAAALAQVRCDHLENGFMITLGTGVGGGLILNGHVVEGSHCACAEVGHLFVDDVHRFPCTCGLEGCLETVASATGVVRLFLKYYDAYPTKLSRSADCKQIFDAAKEQDPLSMFVIDRVAFYLARGLSMIAVTVDVEAFYIGGGVAACGEFFLDSVRNHYRKLAHYAVKDTAICFSELKNEAGMIGAALLLDEI